MAAPSDTTGSGPVPAGEVIEVDGLLWKPKSGATSSGEQFSRARSLLLEIHRDASWNPWVEEDRTQEYQQAAAVFEQWTRAEPGFRQLTSEEVDVGMATWDAEFEARNAERDRQQAARVALYDEGREQARLALLEQQAILRHCSQKLDDLRERRRFPAMPEQPRRAQIAELQQSVAAARTAVVRLQEQVGDVDTVVDQHGWLPQERRELALSLFSARRCSEVRELRERVREQPTTLQATKGRAERAPHPRRAQPGHPAAGVPHGDTAPRGCRHVLRVHHASELAWLRHHRCESRRGPVSRLAAVGATDLQGARDVRRRDQGQACRAAASEAGTAGCHRLWAADRRGARQLAEIQARYPDARVRRGNRNRWEIWPE